VSEVQGEGNVYRDVCMRYSLREILGTWACV